MLQSEFSKSVSLTLYKWSIIEISISLPEDFLLSGFFPNPYLKSPWKRERREAKGKKMKRAFTSKEIKKEKPPTLHFDSLELWVISCTAQCRYWSLLICNLACTYNYVCLLEVLKWWKAKNSFFDTWNCPILLYFFVLSYLKTVIELVTAIRYIQFLPIYIITRICST